MEGWSYSTLSDAPLRGLKLHFIVQCSSLRVEATQGSPPPFWDSSKWCLEELILDHGKSASNNSWHHLEGCEEAILGLNPLKSTSLVDQPYPHKPQTPQRGPRNTLVAFSAPCMSRRTEAHKKKQKETRKNNKNHLHRSNLDNPPIFDPILLEWYPRSSIFSFFRYIFNRNQLSLLEYYSKTFSEFWRSHF